MDTTKNLQQLERQMKTLTQDFRHLRVALNAYLAFASLDNTNAAKRGSWTQKELETSLQQMEEDLQAFAISIFDRKVEEHEHAA